MGERKCAFDGCNALEFRESGYCLRHKGGSPDERILAVASEPRENGREPVTESWPIPLFALGYVPLVLVLLILVSFSGAPFSTGFSLYLFSSMCLVVLLPVYAVYLARTSWQRYKNGNLTKSVALFHFLSFIVPFVWLVMFAVFASNFNGIV